MRYIAFCNLAVIPVRAQAAHRSEMVTQLLFGEAYEVTDWQQDWAHIRTLYDNYEGYVDTHQIAWMHESTYENLYVAHKPKTASMLMRVHDEVRGVDFIISPGSTLPLYDEQHIQLGTEKYTIAPTDAYADSSKHGIVNMAKTFMNSPYLWGGRSIMGIDCSGLVQVVHKIVGITLPRDASQQALVGNNVEWADAREGDIAFFDNENGRIVHVGIVQDKHIIVHSSGKVRTDHLDAQGIYCVEREEYSHHLKCIRRI